MPRTFVNVATVPSENNFEYLMFSIYFFLLLVLLFLKVKAIPFVISFFPLKKYVHAFITEKISCKKCI